MDEESATTVALPFLLRGRWHNTATVLQWAIPVNKDIPLLRNDNCILRG